MYPYAQTGRKSLASPADITSTSSMLIIDDDRAASITLSFMLTLRGYTETRAVRSAARALIVANKFRPEIVFLDLDLPNTDTLELARQLRKSSSPHPPRLVALTSNADHPLRDFTRKAGFERHLLKPCDQVEVDKILRLSAAESA